MTWGTRNQAKVAWKADCARTGVPRKLELGASSRFPWLGHSLWEGYGAQLSPSPWGWLAFHLRGLAGVTPWGAASATRLVEGPLLGSTLGIKGQKRGKEEGSGTQRKSGSHAVLKRASPLNTRGLPQLTQSFRVTQVGGLSYSQVTLSLDIGRSQEGG